MEGIRDRIKVVPDDGGYSVTADNKIQVWFPECQEAELWRIRWMQEKLGEIENTEAET